MEKTVHCDCKNDARIDVVDAKDTMDLVMISVDVLTAKIHTIGFLLEISPYAHWRILSSI